MFRQQLLLLALLIMLPIGTLTEGDEQESQACALVSGAKQKILSYDRFRVCYTETRAETNQTISQVVDYDHGKMRKEHLKNDKIGFVGWVAVQDENDCCTFRFNEGEDAKLSSPNSPIAEFSGLYDPRILFLGDVPSYFQTVGKRLQCVYFQGAKVSVLDITVDEQSVKEIVSQQTRFIWKCWITEPGFQIMRIFFDFQHLDDKQFNIRCNTVCKYENPNLGPFPSEISFTRENGGKICYDRTIKVTSFEIKDSFPPDTFTYKSMNLPLNTAVVDYRISRRLGYWDGEKLVDDPVRISAQEQRKWEEEESNKLRPRSFGILRAVCIGAGILMIVFAILFKLRQRWKRN